MTTMTIDRLLFAIYIYIHIYRLVRDSARIVVDILEVYGEPNNNYHRMHHRFVCVVFGSTRLARSLCVLRFFPSLFLSYAVIYINRTLSKCVYMMHCAKRSFPAGSSRVVFLTHVV